MIVQPIKTSTIRTNQQDLVSILDEYLSDFSDKCILVITSKIVSLCEGRAVDIKHADKTELIHREADRVLAGDGGKFGIKFTITNNTLIPTAGIDESNTDGYYVLWPKDPQTTANQIREYLVERFKVKHAGVIISDSTCSPLSWGTYGISLAHSGFKATNNYVGKKDIFGRKFNVSRSNVAGGLAASAVVTMGEGSEQTPLCMISDAPFVNFQSRNPSKKELEQQKIPIDEDLFAPFLQAVEWE